MDAATIDLLVSMLPSSSIPRVTVASTSMHQPSSYLHAKATEAFISQYMRPAFGWHAATELARLRAPFPVPMLGRDQWVYRAYMMLLDERRFYDKTVAMAFSMHNTKLKGMGICNSVQAMLLSMKSSAKTPAAQVEETYRHIRETAETLGLPYDLVEAYEVLFYNILDRRDDSAFIANEVYPQTRAIEFDESYFANSNLSDMIKRAGYNHRDKDLTAYLIGIGDRNYMTELAGREDREVELTRHFMGNGLILARTNLLNHRAVGLSRATTLMAAARQGGSTAADHPLAMLSDSFTAQVGRLRQVTQEGYMLQQRIDAGEVSPPADSSRIQTVDV